MGDSRSCRISRRKQFTIFATPSELRFPPALVETIVGVNGVTYYFCPSRRRPVTQEQRYLMDYASSVPTNRNLDRTDQSPVFDYGEYWCHIDPHNHNLNSTAKCTAFGIIARTPRFGHATRPQHVTDGLSNTMMYGEKWLHAQRYETGDWHDDRGWTDGYDPDIVRSTALPPRQDDDIDNNNDPYAMGGRIRAASMRALVTERSTSSLGMSTQRSTTAGEIAKITFR